MPPHPPVRFAAIGLNHGHIYSMVESLLAAGAQLVAFFAEEPDLASSFSATFPQARFARSAAEILEDPTIALLASAAIPADRAALSVAAMRHGKDVLVAKPGATTQAQLEDVRRAQAETGSIYSVFFSERLGNHATVRAGQLVHAGAIGQVVQTLGLGPHRLGLDSRPAWFFQPERAGGILADIASHQVDQFLFFTGSTSAQVVAAQVANYAHPQQPTLEDFGDMTLRSPSATGYIRVDWLTPDGLPTWGDGRLVILGTEGYIELRKYVDIAGRPGGSHLFLCDARQTSYVPCDDVELPFARQLLADIRDRTATAMPQEHVFLASELALRAQAQAARLGFLGHEKTPASS